MARYVSLCPSITETLIDLGVADRLVGITRFCIHPEAVVSRLPKVGGTKDPYLDAIRAAKPDVVFMNAEENRREDHDALSASLRIDVSEPRRVAEVPALLRHFGHVTDRVDVAEARAKELEAGIAAARNQAPKPFRYAYLIWRKPWMAAGAETYVDDILRLAGGENIFGDSSTRYPEIALSDLSRADRVFLADEPFPFTDDHAPEVAAVTDAEISVISGDDCCWHGVRSIRGVALMQRLAR